MLKQVQKITAFFLSRTGEHLYIRDAKGDHEALVYSLATPAYTDAINKFNKIDIYVNAVGSLLVFASRNQQRAHCFNTCIGV